MAPTVGGGTSERLVTNILVLGRTGVCVCVCVCVCVFLTRSKPVRAWGARPLIVALSDKIFLKGGGYIAFPLESYM